MRLQILLILTLCNLCFFTQISVAQKYQMPKVTKLYPTIPDYYKPIEYRFSNEINDVIGGFISKIDTTENSFWGQLEICDSINELRIWDYYNPPLISIDTTTDLLGKLLSSTNRYCNVRNHIIPITFPSDTEFGGYGFVMTGTPLVIKFKQIKYGQYKIIWVGQYD